MTSTIIKLSLRMRPDSSGMKSATELRNLWRRSVKIKIFKNHDFVRLEEKVNLFIRDVKVISTQLTIIPPTEESYTQYVVLVTYEG